MRVLLLLEEEKAFLAILIDVDNCPRAVLERQDWQDGGDEGLSFLRVEDDEINPGEGDALVILT